EARREVPALAVQRFGRGRVGALLIGDLWRWGMRDATAHEDMDKAWRQLMRWLVADVPNRVELTAEKPPADASGSIQLEVRVRNARYEPQDNAGVSIEVEPVIFG